MRRRRFSPRALRDSGPARRGRDGGGLPGQGPTALEERRAEGASGRDLCRRNRLERFEKEARAASSLNYPNIVTIYEIGSSGSVAYIAMELVEGRTLLELSTRQDRLTLADVGKDWWK